MSDKLFLAWAAGFFDGEGCVLVTISKNSECLSGHRAILQASASQTSRPCLEKLVERFGGAVCAQKYRTPKGRRWSVAYQWTVRSEAALDFLRAVQPYSVVKRTQIDLALTYPLLNAEGRKHGSLKAPIPPEVFAERVRVADGLKAIRAEMKTPAEPARV